MSPPTSQTSGSAYEAIDRVAPRVAELRLAYPVMISPSLAAGAPWGGRSDAQDRPKRVKVTLDASGRLLGRMGFRQRNWVDQAVGVGVAAHEGQLFGWPNQLIGLIAALSLLTVSVSAVVLWWRRRPGGVLGAPLPAGQPRFSVGLLAIIVGLGALLPLFGLSLCIVFLAERMALRRMGRLAGWLGL